ncbi:methylenetetrahydrofolate reductase C-terminal domain-containing protein [Dehalobacter sp. DCM]|uniref:methylenetetrahydrofolate reductase C-terminal domain-containing protein n=1 Tax=Dehalobacter sp. DCM TaxID=2907827 RepID=UPI00308179BB|nr:methylenetetrahydrofolate reductase C-terminal domain-containing protein [Dehalobacter sp. DCM]
MENAFKKAMLDPNEFIVTWELVPGRGSSEVSQEKALLLAEQAAKGKKVHGVSLTDNPGGNVGIQPEGIGREIKNLGMEVLIHLACKDKNRTQLESQLDSLERSGLHNLLVLTGDYDLGNVFGRPKPVFDMDSTQLLKMVAKMNDGLELPTAKGSTKLKPTHFYAGAAVSPFKATEAEQMLQYSKMRKKVENGAQFIIPQVGYDVRKYHELYQYAKHNNINANLMGNIYLLTYGAGKAMNMNKVPGCVVTDKLVAELDQERQSSDKGAAAMLERAAKLFAILKGMGYKGVHLGGHNTTYEQIEYVIDRGNELAANWLDYVKEFDYPQKNGFYVYAKDEKTGLNKPEKSNDYGKSDSSFNLNYKVSRMVHKMLFVPNKAFFGPMQSICHAVKDSAMEKPFHGIEHFAKSCLYNCQDCGDCALTDVAYVCPMGKCPKNQRNGPCEGSYHDWCEVYPNKQKCVWVQAYDRMSRYGEEEKLNSYHVDLYDWSKQHTSGWINFYEGDDHSAERLKIKPKAKKNSDK